MLDHSEALAHLERSARSGGFDARPILLRVATDLFVGRPDQHAADSARYEQLVLGLIDGADIATKTAIARKLAGCAHAPEGVLDRLLAEPIEVAAPLLTTSRQLSEDTLASLIVEGDAAVCAAIAQRRDLGTDLARMLAHHDSPLVTELLAVNRAVRIPADTVPVLVDKARTNGVLARALLDRHDLDPSDLAGLYLQADGPRRKAILQGLELAAMRRPTQGLRLPEPGEVPIVEAAGVSGRKDLFVEAVAAAFGIGAFDAARLVSDGSGEALVLTLRAAGSARETIGKVLLITRPDLAQSVTRFYELIELADATSRRAAQALVAALAARPERAVRHDPLLDDAERPLRAGERRQVGSARPAVLRPASRTA